MFSDVSSSLGENKKVRIRMELQDNPGNLNTEHEFTLTISLFTLNLPSYFLMKTTCYPELWATQTFIISNYMFILLTR